MTAPDRAPSSVSPWGATLVALIGLYACFMLTASPTGAEYLQWAVIADLALVALAVEEWVRYVRRDIDFKLGRRQPQSGLADPVAAPDRPGV